MKALLRGCLQTDNAVQAALDVLSSPVTNTALQQHLAARSAQQRPREAAVVSCHQTQFLQPGRPLQLRCI